MNYLTLTHDQVESIQREYPLFDTDEIPYSGGLNYFDISVDGARSFGVSISWLEIRIEGRWHTLIYRENELKGAIIDLEDSQYSLIKETLLKQSYDR